MAKRIYQRSSRVEEIACHSVIVGSLINPRLEKLKTWESQES